jgi:hypothetical protein
MNTYLLGFSFGPPRNHAEQAWMAARAHYTAETERQAKGVARLTRERDEAHDLIEDAWNRGPTLKTLPLGDWLRARGRGPALAVPASAEEEE